jgi:hypothetical protein
LDRCPPGQGFMKMERRCLALPWFRYGDYDSSRSHASTEGETGLATGQELQMLAKRARDGMRPRSVRIRGVKSENSAIVREVVGTHLKQRPNGGLTQRCVSALSFCRRRSAKLFAREHSHRCSRLACSFQFDEKTAVCFVHGAQMGIAATALATRPLFLK